MPTPAEALEAELVSALHAFRKHCRERKAAHLSALRMLRKQHDHEVAHIRKLEERLLDALDPDSLVLDDLMVNWSPGTVEDIDLTDMPSGDISDALNDVKSAKEAVSKQRFGSFARPRVTARRKRR